MSIFPEVSAGINPVQVVLTTRSSLPKLSAIFLAIWTSYPLAYWLVPSIGTAPLESSSCVQLNGA